MALYPIKISELPQSTTIPTSALLPVAFPGEILTQSVTYGTLLCSVSAALIDTSVPELKQNIAERLPLSGGTITGHISTGALANPLRSTELINKGYADSKFASITGTVMTGFLVLTGDPYNANDAATKAYVDANASTGISLATAAANFLPLSGGRTVNGTVNFASTATFTNSISCTKFLGNYYSYSPVPYAIGYFIPRDENERRNLYGTYSYSGGGTGGGNADVTLTFNKITGFFANLGTTTPTSTYSECNLLSSLRPGHLLYINFTSTGGTAIADQPVFLRYISSITPTSVTWVCKANPNIAGGATSGTGTFRVEFCDGPAADIGPLFNTQPTGDRTYSNRSQNIANVCRQTTGYYIVNLVLDSNVVQGYAGTSALFLVNQIVPFASSYSLINTQVAAGFTAPSPTTYGSSYVAQAWAPAAPFTFDPSLYPTYTRSRYDTQYSPTLQGGEIVSGSRLYKSGNFFIVSVAGDSNALVDPSSVSVQCYVNPAVPSNLYPSNVLYANNPT